MAMQMVVYLVCYSLQVPANEQQSQVKFWLQFLNSALPMTSQLASSKWKVMMVGLRSDEAHPSSNFTKQDIGYWQQRFKRLPLHKDELFAVSSKSSPASVAHLLQAVESVCSAIFQAHCVRIPSSYRKMLEIIQSLPKEQHFSSIEDIRELVAARSAATTTPDTLHQSVFLGAMKYFHATGHVVLLDKDTICIDPTVVPKVAANFISPESVRKRLIKKGDVTLLNEGDIQCILQIADQENTMYEKNFYLFDAISFGSFFSHLMQLSK